MVAGCVAYIHNNRRRHFRCNKNVEKFLIITSDKNLV